MKRIDRYIFKEHVIPFLLSLLVLLFILLANFMLKKIDQFLGKGLGGGFLTAAVEKAWEMGAARVWVHTCSFDHPNALKNYQARGFQIYRESLDK